MAKMFTFHFNGSNMVKIVWEMVQNGLIPLSTPMYSSKLQRAMDS